MEELYDCGYSIGYDNGYADGYECGSSEDFERMIVYNSGYDAGRKQAEERIMKKLYEKRGMVIKYQGKTYAIMMSEIISSNEKE